MTVAIPGTPYRLYCHGDGAPGRKDPYTLEVALRGAEPPKGLKRIDLEMRVAGRRILFTDRHDPKTTFIWDGLDAYGRPVQGSRPAVVRVGYVYDAAPPTRQECILWREQRVMLGDLDARAQNLGGWTLNIHRAYDPIGARAASRRRRPTGRDATAGDHHDGRRRHGRVEIQWRRPACRLVEPFAAARPGGGAGRQPVHRGRRAEPHPPRGAGRPHLASSSGASSSSARP